MLQTNITLSGVGCSGVRQLGAGTAGHANPALKRFDFAYALDVALGVTTRYGTAMTNTAERKLASA